MTPDLATALVFLVALLITLGLLERFRARADRLAAELKAMKLDLETLERVRRELIAERRAIERIMNGGLLALAAELGQCSD